MPPSKKTFRDQAAILNGRLASPQKAIKCVAAIALSPVKARPQKKHRNNDPEDHELATSESIQEPGPSAANKENADVFLEDSDPVAQYQGEFHQGSTPETPTAAPMAFTLKGKLFTAKNPANQSPLQDDDPESDNDNDLDSETVPPELDELCAVDAGAFAGDGYPRPAPPKTFIEKMAALGTKKALAAAPDITSAKAALMDIELVLRGPSRGKGGGYTPPDLSPWVRVRMEGIRSHLAQYTNPNSVTYRKWGISARQAAIAAGRDVVAVNPFGKWKQSMLVDEDLATDVREHLQELGQFITADKLVDYLSREDIMDKHGLDKKISVRTARRYLNELGYR
ncbi:hypothetical protein B0H10DRAFT_2221886 [Mycena sp. CBHHK59/15]|nr:hypothetical protein B0H10DRAFT_2221886 [Mycena sp. CBHHK59/15]